MLDVAVKNAKIGHLLDDVLSVENPASVGDEDRRDLEGDALLMDYDLPREIARDRAVLVVTHAEQLARVADLVLQACVVRLPDASSVATTL